MPQLRPLAPCLGLLLLLALVLGSSGAGASGNDLNIQIQVGIDTDYIGSPANLTVDPSLLALIPQHLDIR